jgi:hypothetical protein
MASLIVGLRAYLRLVRITLTVFPRKPRTATIKITGYGPLLYHSRASNNRVIFILGYEDSPMISHK